MKLIGIDPGVRTGFAIWDTDEKIFETIETINVWDYFFRLEALRRTQDLSRYRIYIEDARMRGGRREAAQGAGWVKTLSSQYEKYAKSLGFDVIMQRPSRTTKMSTETFKNVTKYKARTSNHARDAAMLVFGRI
jgi:hypothetical protein